MEDDSIIIIIAAAKLIKNQIKQTVYTTEEYPAAGEIGDINKMQSRIPDLLNTFLNTIGHEAN